MARAKQPPPWQEGERIDGSLFTFIRETEPHGIVRKVLVTCACSPGMPIIVNLAHLRHGHSKSCGCQRGRKKGTHQKEEEDMAKPYKPQWQPGEQVGKSRYVMKEELGLLPTGDTVTRHVLLTCTTCNADRPIQLSNAKRGTLHCPVCEGNDYSRESTKKQRGGVVTKHGYGLNEFPPEVLAEIDRLEREQERVTYEASKAEGADDVATAAALYAQADEIEGQLMRLKRENATQTSPLCDIPLPRGYRWYNQPPCVTDEKTIASPAQLDMHGPAWVGIRHCLRMLAFDCRIAGWQVDNSVPRWRMVIDLAAALPSHCPYTGEALQVEGTWCAAGRPPHGYHQEGHNYMVPMTDPETRDDDDQAQAMEEAQEEAAEEREEEGGYQ